MFLYYRNSILASMFSVAGCVLGMAGIGLLFSGLIPPGIGLIAAAAVLFYIAKQISRKKSFDQWWKQITKAGLEPEIRNSLDVAVQIYKKNPEPRTLEKIRALNPAAADYIQNGFRSKVPNAYQMPRSTEPEKAPPATQAQKNTSLFCTNCGTQLPAGCRFCSNCGTPVDAQRSGSAVPAAKPQPAPAPKPALQPQQVRAAQPQRMQVPAAAVQSAAPQKETVGEQLDQIMAEVTANLRGKDDLNIYWDCAKRADALYERNREHRATKEHLSALYFLITTRALALHKDSFVEIRRLFAAVQRGLNLDDKRDPIKLDIYAYMLKRYAVEGALIASREKDRNEMQTAYHWMDIAATYTIVGAEDNLKQAVLYNDALNTCRAWLCFWMANSYFQQVPKNQNLAKLYIEESLRYCPAIPSRNCDLNPQDPDQTVVMRREQVEQMWAIICG